MRIKIQQLLVFLTLLSGFRCMAEIINIELESPYSKTGGYTYTALGANSTNIVVTSGEKITIRQHHLRHGYTYPNGNSSARITAKYGTSSNSIQIYQNWSNGYQGSNNEAAILGKTIYGPCELLIEVSHASNSMQTSNGNYEYSLLTYYTLEKEKAVESLSSGSSVNTVSAASIVVPSNAIGDVDVLLEQSNDMITWTQCLPGTYNASTQKRFFRVRAVEK